ncbi:MAG TPA: TetR/AcrR family transcriptional regulator [Ktedonobacterales bacterium]
MTASRSTAAESGVPARRRPHAIWRDTKRAEMRQRLFEAALELFRTQGVAATTIRQIAGAAHTGLGTFFNYFAGKEAVLAEVGRLRQERIEALLNDPAHAEASAHERISDALRALVAGMEEEPDLARAVIQAAMTSPEIFHGERARFVALIDLLEGVLRAGQRRGEIAEDCDVEAAAHLIIAIYVALALDWAARSSDYALEPALLAHVETLWRGLASKGQPTAI